MNIVHGAIVIDGAIYTPKEWEQEVTRLCDKFIANMESIAALTKALDDITSPVPPSIARIEEYVQFAIKQQEAFEATEKANDELEKARDEQAELNKRLQKFIPESIPMLCGDYRLKHIYNEKDQWWEIQVSYLPPSFFETAVSA